MNVNFNTHKQALVTYTKTLECMLIIDCTAYI